MEREIQQLIERFSKRNIQGFYCPDKEEARQELLKLIPKAASIGISGSVTLDAIGIAGNLEARGNKVFNQYRPGLSREESLELRKQGTQADYYLASANAVSRNGELVFFSGYGNRIAGISCSKNVIVVCGINKIVADLSQAIKRSREFATPLNCKRLNWQSACLEDGICRDSACLAPEFKRMCCQVLVIESEVAIGRLKVILVGEKLGF